MAAPSGASRPPSVPSADPVAPSGPAASSGPSAASSASASSASTSRRSDPSMVQSASTAVRPSASIATRPHSPALIHRIGAPMNGMRRKAMPCTAERSIGVESCCGLASPFVTMVPREPSCTYRCMRMWSAWSGSSASRTLPMAISPEPTGRETTTSPGTIRGSIEPVITVVGCQPMSAGAAAQSARPSSVATTPRAREATTTRPHSTASRTAACGAGPPCTAMLLMTAFDRGRVAGRERTGRVRPRPRLSCSGPPR
ncbi:hypothetical protein RU06_04185 [Curtobacterium flaccumfaciens]|nr:hypothetical protein RU06_04185 [Curtobacterium flaccumfaciens]